MTEKPNLAEIERELGEISKWPWRCHWGTKYPRIKNADGYYVMETVPYGVHFDKDAPFIAKSPERIRTLLDVVKELQAKIDTHAQALRETEARGKTQEPCVCCRDVGAPKEICSDGCICSYEAAREMQRKRDAGEICAECDGPADERVKAGMKCGRCAYGA